MLNKLDKLLTVALKRLDVNNEVVLATLEHRKPNLRKHQKENAERVWRLEAKKCIEIK